MKIEKRIDDYFDEIFHDVLFEPIVKAYVLNVFSKFSLSHDLSTKSITLAYFDAIQRSNFVEFQKIGDWSLWTLSLTKNVNADVIANFGKLSYASCYHMSFKSFDLYKTLSYDYDNIVDELQKRIKFASK
jgi:hypothetical protein